MLFKNYQKTNCPSARPLLEQTPTGKNLAYLASIQTNPHLDIHTLEEVLNMAISLLIMCQQICLYCCIILFPAKAGWVERKVHGQLDKGSKQTAPRGGSFRLLRAHQTRYRPCFPHSEVNVLDVASFPESSAASWQGCGR